MGKPRNNDLRIKKSIGKTTSRLKKINQEINQEILKREKRNISEQKQKTMLANIDKMSYNEARKLASSLGISIYQRKKAQIIKDLRQHYEQLETTH